MGNTKYWLFGADPKRYNLMEEIPVRLDNGDSWRAAHHWKDLAVGDEVILWQHGPRGGVYAFGKLTSNTYKHGSEWRVNIGYGPLLKQPVFKRDLRKHPLLRNLGVLKMPKGGNPFPVEENQWRALKELISKDTVSIFTPYQQEENRFTNGLVALLELSSKCDGPLSITSFLDLLPLASKGGIGGFRVLRGYDGKADAELCGVDCCIRFETKIRSGSLDEDQVREHLKGLGRSREALKALVLLTPDDGNSNYIQQFLSSKSIKQFCSKDRRHRVLHLEWRRVYDHLEHSVSRRNALVFSRLVFQFLEQIHDRIFEQDFAGIIQKINFKKGDIDPSTFLQDIEKWSCWHTPRKYEKLDGTGRKLLLYDGKQEKAIVAEVEIERVEQIHGGGDFPWRNEFVPNTLHVFTPPILLESIRKIPGFEDFGKPGGIDMTAYRNITREQYRLLTES
jgi:hypothetical protein